MTDEHNKNKIKHNDNKESTIQLRNINSKREDFLEWNDYFMAVAFLAAMRSKDPCTQVGACIVNEDKKIVGIGYNGMPLGCNDDQFPWSKENLDKLETKYLYVCHAELNAILNKNAENIKNCTLYVGLFPCNECAKVIIQSGIKIVYYISDKHASKCTTVAAKRMFDAAKVEYRQYKPKNEKIIIDFNEINWNEMTQLPSTPLKDNRS
ncbi:PREDICTED: deoxycytidylate deaminase isoform X1 [Ceratosolen solmsi marchali]|uniref:Probable deoxycytidylate deaminase n=1 Tax=Ceratosolen solmsi marchali TaxID=326594 RepID=A0AAJ6YJT7_9HYME|nr:PREDICTED: deoxycytidylate deaminase isoform X1 [Ceratosolen solmsi marchali]